jgi:ubiquinone biosynthesis protein UbiJ
LASRSDLSSSVENVKCVPMLKKNLLSLLERAVRRYLSFDPYALEQLATLSGKVIQLDITDWETTFYLFPSARGIAIKPHYAHATDARIQGTLFALLNLQLADKKTATQLARKLHITGDVTVAHSFNKILQQLEIDWEEPLSNITGDVLAHHIGRCVRGVADWGKQLRKNLADNTREYLQEETSHLPSSAEVDAFLTQVTQLKHDVARLEARLKIQSS